MDGDAVLAARPPTAHLLPELRQCIISILAPVDVVFGLSLSCKEQHLCYREPVHRTVAISQPLPGHVMDTAWCLEGAQAAMKQLTFHQKLLVLSTAASSGSESNVEFAWRLLQPHVFPELLRTEHYQEHVRSMYAGTQLDLGSAAIASGLAHLLPSLAQRCPGLLNPARTMASAARHCDLAGLRAAWEAVEQRLLRFVAEGRETAPGTWQLIACAAAGSETSDAVAKLGWVLQEAGQYRSAVLHSGVCGAAAASGDLSRLAWMRDQGFPWRTAEVLVAVLRHADLGFVQRLEQEGGYLPPVEDVAAWASEEAVAAAAASQRVSVDKLRWLAGRGAALGSLPALHAAAWCGNLEAVQLLAAGQQGQEPAAGERGANAILGNAVNSGSVPLVRWLRQAGYPWCRQCFESAFWRGDLPMVRCLLEAGCPREQHDSLLRAVQLWPCSKPVDNCQLVEALRLLAAAGWPAGGRCLSEAARKQASAVLVALQELLGSAAALQAQDAAHAAFAGCEATLEALVGMGLCQRRSELVQAMIQAAMYASGAENGDRATLECRVRLGVPLGKGDLAAAMEAGAPLAALGWLVARGRRCRRCRIIYVGRWKRGCWGFRGRHSEGAVRRVRGCVAAGHCKGGGGVGEGQGCGRMHCMGRRVYWRVNHCIVTTRVGWRLKCISTNCKHVRAKRPRCGMGQDASRSLRLRGRWRLGIDV